MKAATAALMLLALLVSPLGCRRREDALVVNVIMVGNGTASNARTLSHRIVTFSASRPVTASGRAIVVQETYPSRERFAEFITSNPSLFDIIIADSPQQLNAIPALQQSAGKAASVCGETANCPALIAPWVQPDRLESVQRVYAAITGAGPG